MAQINGAIAPAGSACPQNVELVFRETLQGVFGKLDWLPVADGNIHRFHVPGDRAGTHNGWYVLFADGIASGCFGSWKAGSSHIWSSREPASPVEAEQVRQRIEQARRQREVELRQRQQGAAEYANRLWRDARRADPEHPYLVSKQVRSYALRQHGDQLLVPLYHGGQLVNLQRIRPDGSKRFLSGGQIKGACSTLGRIEPGPGGDPQPVQRCRRVVRAEDPRPAQGHARKGPGGLRPAAHPGEGNQAAEHGGVRPDHGHAGNGDPGPVGAVLRQRQQAQWDSHRAEEHQRRDRAAPEGALGWQLQRQECRQGGGAGRWAVLRAAEHERGRLAAGRATALVGGERLLGLPRAGLQGRRGPRTDLPERRGPQPDLLLGLPAEPDRVVRALPGRGTGAARWPGRGVRPGWPAAHGHGHALQGQQRCGRRWLDGAERGPPPGQSAASEGG